MRLMAADVAAWHRMSGGKLAPNTEVWKKLPLPWQVFQGKAACNKALVQRLCKKAGIDPEKSGWIAPRTHGVAKFTPTPELVHGVEVSNPFLAKLLKIEKWFSVVECPALLPEGRRFEPCTHLTYWHSSVAERSALGPSGRRFEPCCQDIWLKEARADEFLFLPYPYSSLIRWTRAEYFLDIKKAPQNRAGDASLLPLTWLPSRHDAFPAHQAKLDKNAHQFLCLLVGRSAFGWSIAYILFSPNDD